MKVNAKKIETIEVVIDPFDAVREMLEKWKRTIRIPQGTELMKLHDGIQWCKYERGGHTSDWEHYRDATDGEIQTHEAFETVLEVVRNFE